MELGWIIAYSAAAVLWLAQACLSAALARQKGYSGVVGFLISLFFPVFGLIYQAGRPISQEMEDERQRSQALRIAKAIRRSEQAQEKVFRSEEDVDRRRIGRKG